MPAFDHSRPDPGRHIYDSAAATRGDITIDNVIPKHLEAVTAKLQEMGVHVYEMDESIRVVGSRPTKALT